MATRKQRNSKPEPTRDAAASRIYQGIQDAHPLLTVEQERELFRTLAEGDEEAREQARETLLLSNVGLVAKNASLEQEIAHIKQAAGLKDGGGSLDDLMNRVYEKDMEIENL